VNPRNSLAPGILPTQRVCQPKLNHRKALQHLDAGGTIVFVAPKPAPPTTTTNYDH
jgi:hypothetical protein